MKLYLAPLEGITGYVFRNTVHEQFGRGIDKYFTPFIEPHPHKKCMPSRAVNDIRSEHNRDICVVPQILTNSAEAFAYAEREITPYGYKELNINLGCPSGTVTSKFRGSGLLQDINMLDEFLAAVFEASECDISIKTRIGYSDPDEWPKILEVYKKYPLKELIIHPRVREEFYNGTVHYDAFKYALNNCELPLCYNGDINSKENFDKITELFNQCRKAPDAIMLGRGMVRNPALIEYISGNRPESRLTAAELKRFTDALTAGYKELLSGDTPVLHKMKEVWSWLILDIPNHDKLLKKIVKSKKMSDYEAAVQEVFRSIA